MILQTSTCKIGGKLKRLALVFWMGMLLGCSDNIPVTNLPAQLILAAYDSNGGLVSERSIGADDPAYQRLQALLEAHPTGWKTSYASYVTGPYVFRADSLTIRCYKDAIGIDVKEGEKSTSKRKPIQHVPQSLGLPST
ncbi:hypothetical protein [Massilia sp. BJB1822]|uniref:hypothetical protein n=1 Tax=Massilia sp. BJB1822 TaxID=2744470 RepID=UPI001592CE8B|nr:hypothetical protein [Massilia sp. BJB1822]NVD97266.1 hypothetical protein [Massilia sp. BJB1822]